MQVIRKALKTLVLIFVVTVIYGMSSIKAELPLLFCVCYAIHNKSFTEVTVISFVMGIITGAFGRYGFMYSVLLCVYMSYIFLLFSPRKRPFLKTTVLFFICAIICFGAYAVYNTIFFTAIYFFCKKIYKENEKYIFL